MWLAGFSQACAPVGPLVGDGCALNLPSPPFLPLPTSFCFLLTGSHCVGLVWPQTLDPSTSAFLRAGAAGVPPHTWLVPLLNQPCLMRDMPEEKSNRTGGDGTPL